MKPGELHKKLLLQTTANSGLEVRSYLGMSRIGACSRKLYREMYQGRSWTTQDHLYCHLGYLFEQSILDRLKAIDPDLLGPSREFKDFADRFKGHSDGSWDGDLLEIKSVVDTKMPTNGRVPHLHFWQVQTYMKYGGYKKAQIIYVARDTGNLNVVPVRFNEKIAEMACLKAATILEAVDNRQIPECECGWCKS